MTKMLIGLFLICLEITFTIESEIFGVMIIGLLPDFVGFGLLLWGLRELSHENDYFYKNMRFCLWCATVALMIYIMDVIGVTASGDFQPLLLQLLLMVLEPICLFRLVRGIRTVGKDYDIDVKGKLMLIVCIAMTVLSVPSFLFGGTELGAAFGLVYSVLAFAYIALFYNFKCIYEEIRPVEEESEE